MTNNNTTNDYFTAAASVEAAHRDMDPSKHGENSRAWFVAGAEWARAYLVGAGLTELESAEKRIQAVREMHDADGVRWVGFPRADEQVTYCTYCQERSPCTTIRTLDGDV